MVPFTGHTPQHPLNHLSTDFCIHNHQQAKKRESQIKIGTTRQESMNVRGKSTPMREESNSVSCLKHKGK